MGRISEFILTRRDIQDKPIINNLSTPLEEEDPLEPLESKKKNQELSHKDNKHQLAVGTYKKLFRAICAYIILVLLLLTGNKHYFQLESLVLIALLSTTTANILGVFYIASKWLYETDK